MATRKKMDKPTVEVTPVINENEEPYVELRFGPMVTTDQGIEPHR